MWQLSAYIEMFRTPKIYKCLFVCMHVLYDNKTFLENWLFGILFLMEKHKFYLILQDIFVYT